MIAITYDIYHLPHASERHNWCLADVLASMLQLLHHHPIHLLFQKRDISKSLWTSHMTKELEELAHIIKWVEEWRVAENHHYSFTREIKWSSIILYLSAFGNFNLLSAWLSINLCFSLDCSWPRDWLCLCSDLEFNL